mgnify:CR=1 FL=1
MVQLIETSSKAPTGTLEVADADTLLSGVTVSGNMGRDFEVSAVLGATDGSPTSVIVGLGRAFPIEILGKVVEVQINSLNLAAQPITIEGVVVDPVTHQTYPFSGEDLNQNGEITIDEGELTFTIQVQPNQVIFLPIMAR